MRTASLLLSLWLCACAAPATQRPSTTGASPSASVDSLVGSVRVVGSAPVNVRVVLQNQAGSTTLAGDLLPELRQLSGAEVEVHGASRDATFEVASYRIRSVDGRPVVQGTVEGRSGPYVQLRTPEGGLLYLMGAPEDFQVGRKVWVQGPEAVIVQSFGTLR